jgi:hypothetical protein
MNASREEEQKNRSIKDVPCPFLFAFFLFIHHSSFIIHPLPFHHSSFAFTQE